MINRAFIVKYRNKKTQRRKSTKWSSFRKERKNTQVLNDIYGFSPKCIHLQNLFAVVYHPSFTVRLEAKFRRAEKRTTTKCFLTASSKVASRFYLLFLLVISLLSLISRSHLEPSFKLIIFSPSFFYQMWRWWSPSLLTANVMNC